MKVQSSPNACPKLLRESGAQMPFVWHLSHTDSSECIMLILLFINCFSTSPGCGGVSLCSLNITTCPADSWGLQEHSLLLVATLLLGAISLLSAFNHPFEILLRLLHCQDSIDFNHSERTNKSNIDLFFRRMILQSFLFPPLKLLEPCISKKFQHGSNNQLLNP